MFIIPRQARTVKRIISTPIYNEAAKISRHAIREMLVRVSEVLQVFPQQMLAEEFVIMVFPVPTYRRKMKNKGFTLIELLIVLAIIGVLSSFLLANLIGAKARARDAQRKSDTHQMQAAFELYRADQGTYPAAPLPACGSGLVNGGSTYMQKVPCDPMNSGQFVYNYTTTGATYTLTACLENVNDSQKDKVNNGARCTGTTNWSYTLNNP
jgi:general secretion pathway protein G